MSIINNANPGSHIESLFLLDRMINEFSQRKLDKRLTEEEINKYCLPDHLFLESEKGEDGKFKLKKDPSQKLQETLRFWCEEGLWDCNEEGIRSHSTLDVMETLPARLLNLMASKEYDFLNGSKIEPFLRYVTLFLAIDELTIVHRQFLDRAEAQKRVASLIDTSQVGRMTLNTSELPVFFGYAHLLGFIEKVEGDRYAVDPTRALKVFLDSVFKNEQSMFVSEFLQKLNQRLPLFDQGEYRKLVEEQVVRDNDEWSPEKGVRLSASLSIALYRLSSEQLIRYDLGSDSKERFYLTLPTGEEQVISNIHFLGSHA